MINIKLIYLQMVRQIEKLRDLPLLFLRLILAYGFFEPALRKLTHFNSIVEWFKDDLQIPFPYLNALLATGTECLGVVFVTLGFCTRLISIPMMFVMIVAIATVHYQNGFSCGDNGFEVPFYYFFMLFTLVVYGAGRFSLDYLIFSKSSLVRTTEVKEN